MEMHVECEGSGEFCSTLRAGSCYCDCSQTFSPSADNTCSHQKQCVSLQSANKNIYTNIFVFLSGLLLYFNGIFYTDLSDLYRGKTKTANNIKLIYKGTNYINI